MSVHFGAMIPVAFQPSLGAIDARLSAARFVERANAAKGKELHSHYEDTIRQFDPAFDLNKGISMAFTLKNGRAPGEHGQDRVVTEEYGTIGDVFLLTGEEKQAVSQSQRAAYSSAYQSMQDEMLHAMQNAGGRANTFYEQARQRVLEAQDKALRTFQMSDYTKQAEIVNIPNPKGPEYKLNRVG